MDRRSLLALILPAWALRGRAIAEPKPEPIAPPQPFQPFEAPPFPQLEWMGSTYEGVDADSLLRAEFGSQRPHPAEIEEARKFFDGQQWDEQVQAERLTHKRPCLILNRMPELVGTIICNSGPCVLSDEDMDAVVVAVVRRNRDAQLATTTCTRLPPSEPRSNVLPTRAPLPQTAGTMRQAVPGRQAPTIGLDIPKDLRQSKLSNL